MKTTVSRYVCRLLSLLDGPAFCMLKSLWSVAVTGAL